MKVVIVHNYYQHAGGEDRVVAAESALLTAYGHQVVPYVVHNQSINSLWQKLRLWVDCIFSVQHYRRFRRFLQQQQPDVVHVHNYFPLLSPAIFYAAQHEGIAVVHSLHNFRAICPSATLFDGARVQTQSVRHSPFWAVRQKVYRQSYLATLLVYLMVVVHRRVGTWQHQVDHFIALSPSGRDLYLAAGWPAAKVSVKANFIAPVEPLVPTSSQTAITAPIPEATVMPTAAEMAGAALFVGRLSPEKGVQLLLSAWSQQASPLYLVGSGPLQADVQQAALNNPLLKPLGAQSPAQVQLLMQQASLLIVPSTCLETFGLVVLEAFRQRLPVLVAAHGALSDLVQHGHNGWHFQPADAADLGQQARFLLQDQPLRQQLGAEGWRTEQQHFDSAQNYQQLLAIYQQAISTAHAKAQRKASC